MAVPIASIPQSSDLRKDGMAVEKIALVPVWREAEGLFDKLEQAALAWIELVTRIADTGAPDADCDAARKQFSEREIADLMGRDRTDQCLQPPGHVVPQDAAVAAGEIGRSKAG